MGRNWNIPTWLNLLIIGLAITISIPLFWVLLDGVSINQLNRIHLTGLVVEVILTLALVGVYLQVADALRSQSEISAEQKEILNAQRKISELEHSPYLVGPYEVRWDEDAHKMKLKLTNAGDGPARNLMISTELELFGEDGMSFRENDEKSFSGGNYVEKLEREGQGFLEPNLIHPGEKKVGFEFNGVPVRVFDKGKSENIRYIDAQEEGLIDEVHKYCLSFTIKYEDNRENSENPYGVKYQLKSPEWRAEPDESRPHPKLLSQIPWGATSL